MAEKGIQRNIEGRTYEQDCGRSGRWDYAFKYDAHMRARFLRRQGYLVRVLSVHNGWLVFKHWPFDQPEASPNPTYEELVSQRR